MIDLEGEDVASDDLNIRSSHNTTSKPETRLSKYSFTPDVRTKSSYLGYTVAQDGKEFKEIEAQYSKIPDSDPIEAYTPDNPPRGFVKEQVVNYEKNAGTILKVDFTKLTTKSKMKRKMSTVRCMLTLAKSMSLILMNFSAALIWSDLLHRPVPPETMTYKIIYP